MKPPPLLSALIVSVSLTAGYQADAAAPLPRSTPEAEGVPSKAVTGFVESLDKIATMHSFMVLRHGKVIAEGWWKPEAAEKAHVLN